MKEMFERSMAPDSGGLSEICSGLCQCGKIEEAKMLCSEMEARGLIPAGFDKSKTTNFGA